MKEEENSRLDTPEIRVHEWENRSEQKDPEMCRRCSKERQYNGGQGEKL